MPLQNPIQICDVVLFDAYGTLFDVNAAATACKDELGPQFEPLANAWRQRQLHYTWLQSLMGHYEDFWQITQKALDFAMDTVQLQDSALRARLLHLYMNLSPYPEVHTVLGELRDAGKSTGILSNGAPAMLKAAVDSAGLASLLDHVISADRVRIFKPHPKVYALGEEATGVPPERTVFLSANGWDAHGAAAFGYQVVWVNRGAHPKEYLPGQLTAQIPDLQALLPLLQLTS